MQTFNRVFLLGHLGSDPEQKVSRSGEKYARLSLATHRRWRNESGESQEKTDWHRVLVWGAKSEVCAKRLTKGSPVMVEGTINRYEAEGEGGEVTKGWTISAREISFLGPSSERPAEETSI